MTMDTSELLNKIKELENKITTLDTSVGNLTTALNNMSSKMTTPTDTDIAVSSYSTKFKYYDILAYSTGALFSDKQSLTQKSLNYTFCVDTTNNNIYYYDSDAGMVGFTAWAVTGLVAPFIAWDWTNGQMFAMDDTDIQTWDSTAALIDTQTLTHSSWVAGDWTTKALAHDETNDQLYAVLYNPTTYDLVYVKVNPATGAMTEDVEISNTFNSIIDAEILTEKLYMLDQDNEIILIYRLGEDTPYLVTDIPAQINGGFSVDKNEKSWLWLDNQDASLYLMRRALSFVQRVAIEDANRAPLMSRGGAVATGANQRLVDASGTREAIIIINMDDSEIVYVDAGTASVADYPIYPKNSLTIEGYTGQIYMFAAVGTEVRYLELSG